MESGGARAGRGARLLVVEDEPDLLMVVELELSEAGYFVTAVGDGRAAFAAARRGRFDVAITDLSLPDIAGVDTVGGLRQLDPALPIIVATGYASASDELAQAGHAVFAVLIKPFSIDELLGLVGRALWGQATEATR